MLFLAESAASLNIAKALSGSYSLKIVTTLNRHEHFSVNFPSYEKFRDIGLLPNNFGSDDLIDFTSNENFSGAICCNDQSSAGSLFATVFGSFMPIFTIQDGFLDFSIEDGFQKPKPNDIVGANSDVFFGWSFSSIDRFRNRKINLDKLVIAGDATSALGRSSLFATTDTGNSSFSGRVVLVDQPFDTQGDCDRETYFEFMGDIAKKSESLGKPQIRHHPSRSSSERTYIEKELDLTKTESLQKGDIVISAFSSLFVEAVNSGCYVILVDKNPGLRSVPRILSPQIRNVSDLGEVGDSLDSKRKHRVFAGNNSGLPFSHFYMADDAISIIKERIDDFTGANPRQVHQKKLASREWADLQSKPLMGMKLAIVADRLIDGIGVSISVMEIFHELGRRGYKPVMIDLDRSKNVVLDGFNAVLINSITPIRDSYFREALDQYMQTGKGNVFLYPHEELGLLTEKAVNNPHWIRHLLRLIPSMNILTVSDRSKEQYIALGAKNPFVIGEASNKVSSDSLDAQPHPKKKGGGISTREDIIVLIVGTVQERKGLTIFVDLTIRLQSAEIPIRFVWMGKPRSFRHQNKNVSFIGEVGKSGVDWWMQRATLLLVPSREDPAPLVIPEALSRGLPVLAYRSVGIGAPDFEKDRNLHFFDEYTAESIYGQVEKILGISQGNGESHHEATQNNYSGLVDRFIEALSQNFFTSNNDSIIIPQWKSTPNSISEEIKKIRTLNLRGNHKKALQLTMSLDISGLTNNDYRNLLLSWANRKSLFHKLGLIFFFLIPSQRGKGLSGFLATSWALRKALSLKFSAEDNLSDHNNHET